MRSVAFNAASSLLASGAVNGKVVVWDVASKAVVQDVGGTGGAVGAPNARGIAVAAVAVNALVFTPGTNGKLVLGNADSGVVSVVVPVPASVVPPSVVSPATPPVKTPNPPAADVVLP